MTRFSVSSLQTPQLEKFGSHSLAVMTTCIVDEWAKRTRFTGPTLGSVVLETESLFLVLLLHIVNTISLLKGILSLQCTANCFSVTSSLHFHHNSQLCLPASESFHPSTRLPKPPAMPLPLSFSLFIEPVGAVMLPPPPPPMGLILPL